MTQTEQYRTRVRGERRKGCRVAVAAAVLAASVGTQGPIRAVQAAPMGAISVVAGENFYGSVIVQIGGSNVSVLSILSNPTTDPHMYESSTVDGKAIAHAQLVVQAGIGYDAFMNKLEAASPNAMRVVIDVGASLGYKEGDNPHLWYNPTTMPRVAMLVRDALTKLDPMHAASYTANAAAFVASLKPWTDHIAALKRRFAGTPVAVTEPVFDYTAEAVGLKVLTPPPFELAIQEGDDPSPQDTQTEQDLIAKKQVKVFIYNQQAVEPVTTKLLGIAHAVHLPVIGVYETEPLSRSYQQWMEAEVNALDAALSHGTSTERIL